MCSYSPYQITKISTGTIDFKITVEKTNRKKLSELLWQFFFILFILIHTYPLFFITNNKDRHLRFCASTIHSSLFQHNLYNLRSWPSF
jgi:hypothetical protein